MKNINYEKAFKKLVKQIKFEAGLANSERELEWEKESPMNEQFGKGMRFGYESIERLAILLENNEFDFGDDEFDKGE